MTSNPRCVLHVGGGSSTDEVKLFDVITWGKVKQADHARRTTYTCSKYFSIQLPTQYDPSIGYHSKCYKDFTASPKVTLESSPETGVKHRLLRSDVAHPGTSTSGVLEQKCLFCNTVTKSFGKQRREYLASLQMDSGESRIKDAAAQLQDHVLLAKISGLNMISKEVKFHHSCRKSYLSRASRCAEKSHHEQVVGTA